MRILMILLASASVQAADPTSQQTAARVDQLILAGSDVDTFGVIDDATFLRRASLDLIGRPPTVAEITRFGLTPSVDKRQAVVGQLLSSTEYAANWSRYWRDAILRRATNVRSNLVQPAFESWMADSLSQNRPWDAIVTDLLTATGPVNNDGRTALIFAHEGQAEEIAAEASRLFLGIQMQCANCHDHPWDSWKRDDFHEFAAFFPRINVRRDRDSDNMFDYEIASVDSARRSGTSVSQFLLTRIDRNRDNFITEAESKHTPLARIFSGQAKSYIDKNADGKLSFEEIRTAQPPQANRPGQGATEHYMPNLADPSSKGDLIHPAFFVGDSSVATNQKDAARRSQVADLITSPDNPWFARAIVNRLWSELTGSAFYMPIDDLGPDRSAEHADALNVLCEGFVAHGYDLQWLIKTIAMTSAYQRPINTEAEGFVHLEPIRLRSDQLYDALCQTLNVTALPLEFSGRRTPYARTKDRGRQQFAATFGFDPSTPKSDLTGSIPEALFLMNSPQLHNFIKAGSVNSTIARISGQVLTDEDVVRELFLNTVSREPGATELAICMDSLQQAPNRTEGLEDILWSLLNSTEFQSRR